jgi:hypothetical protein
MDNVQRVCYFNFNTVTDLDSLVRVQFKMGFIAHKYQLLTTDFN